MTEFFEFYVAHPWHVLGLLVAAIVCCHEIAQGFAGRGGKA